MNYANWFVRFRVESAKLTLAETGARPRSEKLVKLDYLFQDAGAARRIRLDESASHLASGN